MDYENLLKRGKDNLPDIISVKDRFEIPNIRGHLQGNKTIISNFNQICDILHRDVAHMLKYLLKELASSGDFKNNILIFNRKISSKEINQKIKQYVNIFVLCYDCGKPDTHLITEKNVNFIKCQACGSKHRVKI
jgi:translation initiation factor 2 subunit 2